MDYSLTSKLQLTLLECYCDSAMRNGASNTTILPNYRCGTVCAANKGQDCGGPGTITLFNNPDMYPIASLPTGWSETGCMTEVSGDRALRGYTFAADNMTPKICLTECQSRGYKLAGAEYGRVSLPVSPTFDKMLINRNVGVQTHSPMGLSRLSHLSAQWVVRVTILRCAEDPTDSLLGLSPTALLLHQSEEVQAG